MSLDRRQDALLDAHRAAVHKEAAERKEQLRLAAEEEHAKQQWLRQELSARCGPIADWLVARLRDNMKPSGASFTVSKHAVIGLDGRLPTGVPYGKLEMALKHCRSEPLVREIWVTKGEGSLKIEWTPPA